MRLAMVPIVLVLSLGFASAAAGEVESIDAVLAQWHEASATADEETYFGLMTEDCIFLGTDATERWRRDELREWARDAFDREVAWKFVVLERNSYLDDDGKIAWFEEYLDTGMGPCRASGILVLTEEGWRVKHYDLALTIPNEKIDAVKAALASE